MFHQVRPDPATAWQIVGGEAIVLNVESGRAVGLNEVATFIWPQLEKLDTDQLAEAIVREFNVDLATARADLATFVDRLVKEGLLREVP